MEMAYEMCTTARRSTLEPCAIAIASASLMVAMPSQGTEEVESVTNEDQTIRTPSVAAEPSEVIEVMIDESRDTVEEIKEIEEIIEEKSQGMVSIPSCFFKEEDEQVSECEATVTIPEGFFAEAFTSDAEEALALPGAFTASVSLEANETQLYERPDRYDPWDRPMNIASGIVEKLDTVTDTPNGEFVIEPTIDMLKEGTRVLQTESPEPEEPVREKKISLKKSPMKRVGERSVMKR